MESAHAQPSSELSSRPSEQRGRQVGADERLLGVGHGRRRAEFAPGAAFDPAHDGHHDEAHGRKRDADRTVLGRPEPCEREHCVDRDVGGEAEERERDDAKRRLLARLGVGRRELPGDRSGRQHLDDRVEPEAR